MRSKPKLRQVSSEHSTMKVRLKSPKRVLSFELERVIGNLVGRSELRARDRLERREILFRRRFFGLVMGVAEQVAQMVGVAHVAAEQRLQGVAPKVGLVAFVEKREQPVVRALLSRRRRGRHLDRQRQGDQANLRRNPLQAQAQLVNSSGSGGQRRSFNSSRIRLDRRYAKGRCEFGSQRPFDQ
jgi:hypothetical protein